MRYKRISRFTRTPLRMYGVLSALYILLIFTLPINHGAAHEHNLTTPEFRFLYFTVTLPLLLIWFVAFYGYAKLTEYIASIKKSPEVAGFKKLTSGIGWLAWSLPLIALASIILRAIAEAHPHFHAASVILINYANLLFVLVAFSLIGAGSRNLFNQSKMSLTGAGIRSIMFLFVASGVLYCYLIFRHFDPTSLTSTNNPYYLPVWLMVTTVIVPYLYAWFIGLLACYEIVSYSRQVKGVLYRQALHLLVGGIVAVIISSILRQYVSSITPLSGQLDLDLRLILTLLFRLINGLGFGIIALGAIRLKKIEEV